MFESTFTQASCKSCESLQRSQTPKQPSNAWKMFSLSISILSLKRLLALGVWKSSADRNVLFDQNSKIVRLSWQTLSPNDTDKKILQKSWGILHHTCRSRLECFLDGVCVGLMVAANKIARLVTQKCCGWSFQHHDGCTRVGERIFRAWGKKILAVGQHIFEQALLFGTTHRAVSRVEPDPRLSWVVSFGSALSSVARESRVKLSTCDPIMGGFWQNLKVFALCETVFRAWRKRFDHLQNNLFLSFKQLPTRK